MRSAFLALFLTVVSPAFGQKTLPELKDGTIIEEKAEFRHDGPLLISGRVELKGISLDLRGPITVASGSDLELENVHIKVSDPPGSPNGTSNLRCAGPATISIHNSTMTAEGSAHPIWWLKGNVSVDGFQTKNSEFHLDHAEATLENFAIFELEISHASRAVARHLQLVFLSTHTGDDDKLEFSDIPADHPFSRKLQMGSLASADLTDTTAHFFLVYVHGSSDVRLNRIGRAQLAIMPACKGSLKLPHGLVGSTNKPVTVPEPGASNCPFRLQLNEVNADTWDVYSGGNADLTFTNSVIDELTGDGQAKLTVRDSEVYADWLSLAGEAQLQIDHSTVGALRLAKDRPDLTTSEVRVGGHSRATFDHVNFDCGVVGLGNSSTVIRDSVRSPKYIRQTDSATVKTEP